VSGGVGWCSFEAMAGRGGNPMQVLRLRLRLCEEDAVLVAARVGPRCALSSGRSWVNRWTGWRCACR
jgi:hypothetical protein